MHRSPDLIEQDMQDAFELTARQLEQAVKIAEQRFGEKDERSGHPALIGGVLVALAGNYRAVSK